MNTQERLYCSFCGAADNEVDVMIAIDFTYICGKCVDQCDQIVKAHRDAKRGEAEYQSWFPASQST